MASTVPASPRRASERWLEDPDVRLMLEVREGDSNSFGELARRYGRRVLGYFRRHLGDRMEAEDLTQEVFLRLYRYRHRYKPRAQFSTWVFFIARNVLRNARRSHRRHPSVQLNTMPTEQQSLLEALVSDRAPPPSGTLEQSELAAVVRTAVAGLGGRKQAALELHQFQDHSYAEVAEALNMTAKAAKSLLYRARLELRDALVGFME